jgi:hypothetical protein
MQQRRKGLIIKKLSLDSAALAVTRQLHLDSIGA